MKDENQQNLIKLSKKIFQEEEGVLFCYLFGSQVTKNLVPESDVDLAIYLDESKVKNFSDKRLELIAKISKVLKRETDVIVLNTVYPFLGYVILREGKLIFERNQAKRISFELKKLNEYFDFKPILEMYNERLLNT